MTSLRDEDMDRIYVFDTGYFTHDGVEINPRVAQKGNHYYEWDPTSKRWNHAQKRILVQEIMHLDKELALTSMQ